VGKECRAVFFICAHCDVTAAIAIAASDAANKIAPDSGVGPTPCTNRAWKADSIIATGSDSTGAAGELNFA
jgi:hypothetical protein